MGYLNCPLCKRRLRVPDSLEPLELRCPACKHAFRSDGRDPEEEALAAGGAADASGGPAAESPDEDARVEAAFVTSDAAAGRILSKADEAMLREFGSGTGLLELTREAYSTPPGGAGAAAGPGAAFAPPEGALPAKEELDRQFQIIGTALALANKLVLAHKGELGRARRQSTLGWSLLACMTLAAGALGWWAVSQSGRTDLERAQGANLSQRLADANRERDEYKAQIPKLREELAADRAEHKTTRDELKTAEKSLADARESLATKKGEADTLTAELKGTRAQINSLGQEVERLTASLAAANAGAASSDVATRPATTRPADANAAMAGAVGP